MKKTNSQCYMIDQGCSVHGFIHGKEAEELREGIEKIIARHSDWVNDLALKGEA